MRVLRRVGFGLSMILAPLLFLVSSALGPPHSASRRLADPLPHIAADPDRFLAFALVSLLSLALFVPAVLGVALLLQQRRPLAALAGASLAVVGLLCLAVIQGIQLVQHQMVHPASDRQQMVALLQRLEGGIALKFIFGGLLVGLFLGWVILSAALFATRVVPRAIPASILVSLVINFVGLEMLSRLVFLIGLGWLGFVVLVRRGDAWVAAETDGGRP